MKPFENILKPTEKEQTYRCPCCKYKTLRGRAGFEICPVCFWEDDGQDEHDLDVVRGGPNGKLSLSMAQKNFSQYQASDPKFTGKVRKPNANEL